MVKVHLIHSIPFMKQLLCQILYKNTRMNKIVPALRELTVQHKNCSTSEPSEKTSWCLVYCIGHSKFPENVNLKVTRKHSLEIDIVNKKKKIKYSIFKVKIMKSEEETQESGKFYFKCFRPDLNLKIILLPSGDIFIYSDIYYTYIQDLCVCEMCSLELLIKPILLPLIHL